MGVRATWGGWRLGCPLDHGIGTVGDWGGSDQESQAHLGAPSGPGPFIRPTGRLALSLQTDHHLGTPFTEAHFYLKCLYVFWKSEITKTCKQNFICVQCTRIFTKAPQTRMLLFCQLQRLVVGQQSGSSGNSVNPTLDRAEADGSHRIKLNSSLRSSEPGHRVARAR